MIVSIPEGSSTSRGCVTVVYTVDGVNVVCTVSVPVTLSSSVWSLAGIMVVVPALWTH